MCELNLEKSISRLDGFLSGLAACSGKIRDYSAYSFVVVLKEGTVETAISDYFRWLPCLEFSDVQIFERGLGQLEIEIRPFLVRSFPCSSIEEIDRLRRYLSFRVMEEISVAINGSDVIQVLKLTAASNLDSSESVFFCVRMKEHLIVMQFNNDIEFKKSVQHGDGEVAPKI